MVTEKPIFIRDHLTHASSYADGRVIFDLISPELRAGRRVVVSFDGFLTVPSSFINAAFLPLLDEVSMDQIKQNLDFIDTTKFINELIRDRFSFVISRRAVDNRS